MSVLIFYRLIFINNRTEDCELLFIFFINKYICVFLGSVIKAWDLGIATMKKGELAKFTCKPKYAYGEAGSLPKIPPNATLIFEVELVSWKGMAQGS